MITIIDGPAEAAHEYAVDMRGIKITRGNGAMIVLETNGHEPIYQISKLLRGIHLPQPAPEDLKTLPWKPNPQVYCVAANEKYLADLEAVCPGFLEFLGPTTRISVG